MERITYSGGVSFTSLLTILFITLKLTGVIDWSWWWVTVPLWGPAILMLVAMGIVWAIMFGRGIRELG